MLKKTCWTPAGAVCLAALVACGGGGGGASPSSNASPNQTQPGPTAVTYALAAGFQSRLASGASDQYVVSGTCTGTASIATSPAVATTFDGIAGYSAAQVSTITFSNCLPATGTQTGSTYFDSLGAPIGLSIVNGEYSQISAAPTDLPASVVVGDAGPISTQNTYADATMVVPTGTRVLSYVIEADTAATATATATANFITRTYDVSNELLSTEQARYTMTTAGALTTSSIDVQFSTTSTIHLLYTPL